MTLEEAAAWIGCPEDYFSDNWRRWGVQEWSASDPALLAWRGVWLSWLHERVKSQEQRKAA